MSRLNGFLLVLISVSTIFSACKKSVDTSTPLGQMNAVVTGNQWVQGGTWTSAGTNAISSYGQTPVGYTKILLMEATQTSGTAIHGAILLSVNNYKDTSGAFNIDNSNNIAEYLSINGSDTVLHTATYGTITVTSGTKQNASGYFAFTCTDSTKVTNGVFNVKITAQ